ncbi:MAG: hypothetical protein H6654_06475 [Ardenticatenaceae bacterium]|nr:hypothetical protein [Anaerolineales bacterium]MCB8942056.1 hypothetical protein [Ardenticatenaceae bacterium]MCB8973184.1 hypothetical protein [Ardenticatenaceae bacterium]
MSAELFSFLLMAGLIVILIWGIAKQNSQIQEAKQQLRKLVQQAGGQNIVIWRDDKWGQRGYFQFVLLYEDVNGIKHKHRVTKHVDLWGVFEEAFFWDRPLQLPGLAAPSPSSSKEQLVSEMDAEIKRLQEELRRTREES